MAEHDDRDEPGVPDSDPRHIYPAGDVADLVKGDEFDIELADDQNADELSEFVERAEAGEFGDVDPGLEATVGIARAMLENGGNKAE